MPRLTGEVRVGLDVTARTLAWVRMPPRGVPASETRRNAVADDAGDAVMPGQALVDERVIGVEEVEHAAVLVQDRRGRRAASPRSSPSAAARRTRGSATGRA